MKIVYLSTEAGLGGAERCLEELAVGAKRRDASVESHVVLLADGPLAEKLRRGGVGVTVLPLPAEVSSWGEAASAGFSDRVRALWSGGRASGPALRFSRWLRETLATLHPDIIHTNGAKAHLLGAVAGVTGVPLVWHLHDFLGRRGLSRVLLPLAARRVTLAVANSRAVADDAKRVLSGVPVEFVHNGIDLQEFSPGPGGGGWLDSLAGLSTAEVVRIGLVATFARWKGQRNFLEAAAQVLRRLDGKVRFYVVGGPIYRTQSSQFTLDELKAEASRLGILSSVGFVPFQSEIPRVYRSLDVVVHASTEPEPFGRTIVEAMACGRPVIVRAAGGAAEILSGPDEGVALDSSDPTVLAEAIGSLVTDPARRSQMGRRARGAAEERFSEDRYVDSFLALYRRLLSAPSSRRVLGA